MLFNEINRKGDRIKQFEKAFVAQKYCDKQFTLLLIFAPNFIHSGWYTAGQKYIFISSIINGGNRFVRTILTSNKKKSEMHLRLAKKSNNFLTVVVPNKLLFMLRPLLPMIHHRIQVKRCE